MIQRAKEFSKRKHGEQLDDSGKLYFKAHIEQVVSIVKLVIKDPEVIAAAYLHDTIEDTNTTLEELEKEFSPRVALLVNEVTHNGKKDNWGYYFPRLKSQDGILLKFADRLSNISRMESWHPERRKHYLRKSKFWKHQSKAELDK